jgi:hypothetical protein
LNSELPSTWIASTGNGMSAIACSAAYVGWDRDTAVFPSDAASADSGPTDRRSVIWGLAAIRELAFQF